MRIKSTLCALSLTLVVTVFQPFWVNTAEAACSSNWADCSACTVGFGGIYTAGSTVYIKSSTSITPPPATGGGVWRLINDCTAVDVYSANVCQARNHSATLGSRNIRRAKIYFYDAKTSNAPNLGCGFVCSGVRECVMGQNGLPVELLEFNVEGIE